MTTAKPGSGLLVMVILLVGCHSPPPVAEDFHTARAALHDGEFKLAESGFLVFLAEEPDHELASRASFLLAKAYLGQKRWKDARVQFQRTIEAFPQSLEASKSRYKLAILDLLQDNRPEAITRLQSLATESGPYRPEAVAMLEWLQQQSVAEENEFQR